MKILCVGDPHFKTDNIPEVDLFIEKSLALIREQSPDLCVILGDVLHTHENVHVSPLNKAYEYIAAVKALVPTILLVGNHDMINQTQFLTTHHWMNGMKEWDNLTVVDKVIKKTFDNLTFYFSPYVPNGRFEEALNTLDGEWKNATCIFAHQEFIGCKMGAFVSKHGDAWPLEFPFVVSGHIHSKQSPQPNIYYTGSAMQNAFGESESNTISIFTFSPDGTRNIREVDLELPRKRIVYREMKNVDDYVIPAGNDKIKLTIKGDAEELKQFKKSKKYRELTKQGAKIVFKHTAVETTVDVSPETKNADFLKILRKMIRRDEQYKTEMLEIYKRFFS